MKFFNIAVLAALALFSASAGAAPAPKPKTQTAVQHAYRPGDLACPTRTLEGRAVGDLYALYIGHKGVMPTVITVNFNDQMRILWNRKLARRDTSPAAKRMATSALAAYDVRKATHVTLEDYIRHADGEARLVRTNLDWNRIGSIYFARQGGTYDKRRLALLKTLAGTIDGRNLIAYALTELMPGRKEGELNRVFLDFLLRNGGREYVENIPAVFDGMTSFGPYQFTSYALYDADGQRRGASIPNQALPRNLRIPGSVMNLKGDLHFRAAFLFSVENLGRLVQKLNAKELAALERIGPKSDVAVMSYVAIAHHAPARAPAIARRWLDNNGRLPMRASAGRASAIYIDKTESNYQALHR